MRPRAQNLVAALLLMGAACLTTACESTGECCPALYDHSTPKRTFLSFQRALRSGDQAELIQHWVNAEGQPADTGGSVDLARLDDTGLEADGVILRFSAGAFRDAHGGETEEIVQKDTAQGRVAFFLVRWEAEGRHQVFRALQPHGHHDWWFWPASAPQVQPVAPAIPAELVYYDEAAQILTAP